MNPIDARIHEAACRTITGTPPRGRTWTGPYVKACSTSLTELDAWALSHAEIGHHQVRHLPALTLRCRTRPYATLEIADSALGWSLAARSQWVRISAESGAL